MHLEVNLNCAAGVGLLCQRRVSQLRPRADLLSRQQPVRHEGPGKVAVDVKVSFHQIPPSQVETAQLYFPLTLSSCYALNWDAATHLHLLGDPRVLSAKKTAMGAKVSETIEA